MKKFFVLLPIVFVVTISCVVYMCWGNLDYEIQKYSYICVEDELNIGIEYEFGLSDNEMLDIIKNPSDYYVINIDGNLYNNHIYSVYNWYITEEKPIESSDNYWIDTSPIDATFPLESFSEIFTKCRILVKCEENEISTICEEFVEKDLLYGKSETFITLLLNDFDEGTGHKTD